MVFAVKILIYKFWVFLNIFCKIFKIEYSNKKINWIISSYNIIEIILLSDYILKFTAYFRSSTIIHR